MLAETWRVKIVIDDDVIIEHQFVRTLKAVKCPLCELDVKREKIFHEDKWFITLRTENLKGHRERIMIVYKEHEHSIPRKLYERGLDIVSKISRNVFSYTPKAVIMDSTFATINDHWHLVVTDLDPTSEDFDQILATQWVTVVDNTAEEAANRVYSSGAV